jgi:S-adenosylmethionine synthetase
MYLWTSEAVAAGHPDKVADQIADSILDAYLAADPAARVASEVTILKELVLLSGEITSSAKVDVEEIARGKICEIGYDRMENSFDGRLCEVITRINEQSREISAAVEHEGQIGAGDQGLMFGFACDETENFMPLSHRVAFDLINFHDDDILEGRIDNSDPINPRLSVKRWDSLFLPDAKSQVTVAYNDDGTPSYIHTIVLSTCHKTNATINDVYGYTNEKIIRPIKDAYPSLITDQTKFLINPAGLWTVGGPASDTGLSGRKIVVDNYGADCPIGGGSFSGKDPTKVDRSGAYAARYVAKNIVAAGLAKRCTVQVSYAIGMVDPISIRVQAVGTPLSPEYSDAQASAVLSKMVAEIVDLTPKGIIESFELRNPIYAITASGGHFGRRGLPWERIDISHSFSKWIHNYLKA